MSQLSALIERARSIPSLALAYGPEIVTDPLENLGHLVLPDGELKNGAKLMAPGLAKGGASAEFDGSVDYLDTKWTTRTNEHPDPLCVLSPPLTGVVDFASTLVPNGTLGINAVAGTQFARLSFDGSNSGSGIASRNIFPSSAGTWFISVYIWIPSAWDGSAVRLTTANFTGGANLERPPADLSKRDQWQRIYVKASFVAGDLAGALSLERTGAGPSSIGTGTLYLSAPQMEQAASLGTFFPTPSQLASCEAGWSGAANESPSDIGAFARGSARTFGGLASLASSSPGDGVLLGSSTRQRLKVVKSTLDVSWRPNTGAGEEVVWPGAWPGFDRMVFYLMVFNDLANTAELFVNGVSLGVKAVADSYNVLEAPSLLLGVRGTTEYWKGSQLPFLAFTEKLSDASLWELYQAVAPSRNRPRRKPPLELDIEIETPDDTYRLSSDSRIASRRPRIGTFRKQRGDGHATGSVALSRSIWREYADVGLLDTWRAVGRNGEVAHEARLASHPRTNDPGQEINVNLVGWMTYLQGRKCAPLIINRRLDGWEPPSMQRQADLVTAGVHPNYFSSSVGSQDAGAEGPGIAVTTSRLVSGIQERCELWWFACGEDVGEVRYDFVGHGSDADWRDQLVLASNDLLSAGTFDTGTDHNAAPASNQAVVATVAGRKYVVLIVAYEGATVADPFVALHRFKNLRQIGTHGLTLHGEAPNEGPWLTDVIKYVLDRYRPLVNWADTNPDNTYPLRQATWHDNPASPYEICFEQLNDLALWESSMRENRTLHYFPADLTKYDWVIRTTDPGVTVVYDGPSIERVANGIEVAFTGFDGVRHVLYPSDHPELRDDSETNPANRHGEEIWTSDEVPWPCEEAEALQWGRARLAELLRPKRPATFRVFGHIRDGARHWQQGWRPNESETLGVLDHVYDAPRLIYQANWDPATEVLELVVDGLPQTMDAIVARQQRAREAANLT